MRNEELHLQDLKRLVKLFPYPDSRTPLQGCIAYVTLAITHDTKIEEACKALPEEKQYLFCLAYIVENVVREGWIEFACMLSKSDLYTIKKHCSDAMDARFIFIESLRATYE